MPELRVVAPVASGTPSTETSSVAVPLLPPITSRPVPVKPTVTDAPAVELVDVDRCQSSASPAAALRLHVPA